MKRIILILTAVIFITGNIVAQDNSMDLRDKLLFGLKAGVNFSKVYDTKGEGFVGDPKFGFAAGGFVSIPIGKFLGLQPEILFSQRGFKATGKILGIVNYEFTHTTNYIDVPLLILLKPSGFVTLLAGPQFSFLLKQKDVYGNSSLTQNFENDNIRKNTLGVQGGVDINMSHFVLGIRACWDLQDNNGDGTTSNPRYKNVWYQATLGFRF